MTQANNVAIGSSNINSSGVLQNAGGGTGQATALIPSGCVLHFAMSSVPSGWLACDGSAVSRTTYASLFAAIGTTYGTGDGSTTFNLPNAGGQFIRNWVSGQSTDSGRTFGSTQADAFKSHTHTLASYGPNGSVSTAGGSVGFIAGYGPYATDATGGTETRPTNIAFLVCIKT